MSLGDRLAILNAVLNGTAAVFLVLGWISVRAKRIDRHRFFMGGAFVISILFLISYLTRFYFTGVHRYPGTGAMRTVYFLVLATHTPLAAAVPFLAIRSIYLGLKNRIEAHRRIARVTLPIWMYVSVTGVLIYFMLYQWA
ncbi:MAG TPA: DUF420 domain-containing protein [bacterium]|nr:DUF420 domain-containing protein [bacterium]